MGEGEIQYKLMTVIIPTAGREGYVNMIMKALTQSRLKPDSHNHEINNLDRHNTDTHNTDSHPDINWYSIIVLSPTQLLLWLYCRPLR